MSGFGAADEARDIAQDPRRLEPPGGGEVFRPPYGVEMFCEPAVAFTVFKVFTLAYINCSTSVDPPLAMVEAIHTAAISVTASK